MTRETIFALLKDVQQGGISPENALGQLADLPFKDVEFAKIDHHRSLRLGLPEVIFAAGKTRAQVAEISADGEQWQRCSGHTRGSREL